MKLKEKGVFISKIELISIHDVKKLFMEFEKLQDAEEQLKIDQFGNFRYNMHLSYYDKFEKDLYFKGVDYDLKTGKFTSYNLYNDIITHNNIEDWYKNRCVFNIDYFDGSNNEKIYILGF